MTAPLRRATRRPERPGERGFTLIELAIVMVVAGLLLVPLLRMAGSAVVSTRLKQTQSVLDTASAALISYAAAHAGCLPFATDSEGGQPDTDASGSASTTPDTGDRKTGGNPNAGDLPWATLGLTNDFLDGDGLRIQYYIAKAYTDLGDASTIECEAGFRGFLFDPAVTYDAVNAAMWAYEFDVPSNEWRLYEIREGKILVAGIDPNTDTNNVTVHDFQLPNPLLQVLKGPDITSATDSQNLPPPIPGSDPPDPDERQLQNVFVLIAPGPNRNTDIDRLFSRDSTHKATPAGATWTLSTNDVDDHIFSSEPNVDATDSANSGDDTMLVMTFTQFKAEMSKYGLNMAPVCENPC